MRSAISLAEDDEGARASLREGNSRSATGTLDEEDEEEVEEDAADEEEEDDVDEDEAAAEEESDDVEAPDAEDTGMRVPGASAPCWMPSLSKLTRFSRKERYMSISASRCVVLT